MIEVKSSREKLKVALTITERDEIGTRIAERSGQIIKLELERDAAKSKFKEQLDELQTYQRADLMQLRDRVAERDVAVSIQYDYRQGLVTVIRNDTNAVVRTRVMTADERQTGFGFAVPAGQKVVDIDGVKYPVKPDPISVEEAQAMAKKSGEVVIEEPTDGERSDEPSDAEASAEDDDDEIPFGEDEPSEVVDDLTEAQRSGYGKLSSDEITNIKTAWRHLTEQIAADNVSGPTDRWRYISGGAGGCYWAIYEGDEPTGVVYHHRFDGDQLVELEEAMAQYRLDELAQRMEADRFPGTEDQSASPAPKAKRSKKKAAAE